MEYNQICNMREKRLTMNSLPIFFPQETEPDLFPVPYFTADDSTAREKRLDMKIHNCESHIRRSKTLKEKMFWIIEREILFESFLTYLKTDTENGLDEFHKQEKKKHELKKLRVSLKF